MTNFEKIKKEFAKMTLEELIKNTYYTGCHICAYRMPKPIEHDGAMYTCRIMYERNCGLSPEVSCDDGIRKYLSQEVTE